MALVLLLALIRAWVHHATACELGSVDVLPLENGTSEPPSTAVAITALMSDRLARNGLLPAPAVPGGSLAASTISLVESSPVAPANWVGNVLDFLRRMLFTPRGHKVSGTLRERNGATGCGITIELTDLETTGVDAVRTFWSKSFEAAADDSADYVYSVIASHDRCTPLWQAWTARDGCSITHFQQGLELEGRADEVEEGSRTEEGGLSRQSRAKVSRLRRRALAAYEQAATLEARNVGLRLRVANLRERAGLWDHALKSYLIALEVWPRVFELRYRLAITLSFADALCERLSSGGARDATLLALMKTRAKMIGISRQLPDPTSQEHTKEWLLTWAQAELDKLFWESGFAPTVWRWFWSWLPSQIRRDRERRLYASLARPMSQLRRQRRNVVGMADLCTRVRRGRLTFKRLRRGRQYRFIRYRAHNWQVLYNAGCCLSRLLPDDPSADEREKMIKLAIEHVDEAYHDADGELELGWIRTDPDLERIRATDEFDDWQKRHHDPPKRIARVS